MVSGSPSKSLTIFLINLNIKEIFGNFDALLKYKYNYIYSVI